MKIRALLAASLLVLGACASSVTAPEPRPASATETVTPPPPASSDTTKRGGGMGSGH